MSKRSKEISSFLLGAAVGLVMGYFLNSGKVNEVVDDLKGKAAKWKDQLDKQLDKGKDWIHHLGTENEEGIENS